MAVETRRLSPVGRILARAREILTPKAAWTQLAMARDETGMNCAPTEERACAWCLDGALMRAGFEVHLSGWDVQEARERLSAGLGETYPLAHLVWNDLLERRHGEVLALLDRLVAEDRALVAAGGAR